jgi:hypothetical protein
MVGTYSNHCHEMEQLMNARLPPLPAVQLGSHTIYLPPAPRGPPTDEELKQLEALLEESPDDELLLSCPIYWDGDLEVWKDGGASCPDSPTEFSTHSMAPYF